MALVPCESCRRHVRSGEAACPFCKVVRSAATAAVTAACALSIAGCDTFSPAAKYGGPPVVPPPPDAVALDAGAVTPTLPSSTASGAPASPSSTASSPRLTESPDNGHVVAPVAKYGGPPRR